MQTAPQFTHATTVRFQHVDRAGIAFFARAFEYSHEAFEELLAAAGLSNVFEVEGWGMPLVHADADFRAPMRLGDRLQVQVSVRELGSKSITFAFRIVGADAVLRAEVRHVHAFIDLKTFRPREVPQSFRAALERHGIVQQISNAGT